jgi:hypothetical protein
MSHFGIVAPDLYGQTLRMHGAHKVISAEVKDDKVVIVRQYESNITYGNGKAAPDRVVKEVYSIVDGKIVLEKEVAGTHTPAHYVQETIEFPE